MLECEWTNPGAMLLSSAEEGTIMDQHQHLRQPVFPIYDRSGLELPCMFSPFPSPAPADDYSFNRYGLAPPGGGAAATPPGPTMRIGLNLGVRTYFSSTPDGELMRLGSNIYRRCGGGVTAGAAFNAMGSDSGRGGAAVRCQAEGCGADLARAKHYHRRHKVCEFHSKAAAAVVHGLTQRFCQQCSRFHVLSEFDQGKRSCRKRLAEHNRRRRKTHQPLPALSPLQRSQANHISASSGNFVSSRPSTEGAPPPSPTRMALGRCSAQQEIFGATNSTSSSLFQLGASSCISQVSHPDVGRRS